MRLFFVLVGFATLFLSARCTTKVSNLKVLTKDGYVCDFSNWHGRIPDYGNTCSRMYWSYWAWWKAPYPWCYHNGNNWNYCQEYTWEVEYPKERQMILFATKRKQYYFNYEYTGTTYENARTICRNRGEGWDLATFQVRPRYERDDPRSKLFFENWGPAYDKCLKNIMEALQPLIETWDHFWVRDARGSKEYGQLGFNRQRKEHYFRFYRTENNNNDKKSFVCERSL